MSRSFSADLWIAQFGERDDPRVLLLADLSSLPAASRQCVRRWASRKWNEPAVTGSNCVQSARCPGVRTRESGRRLPSALRWIFVVGPPREWPGVLPAALSVLGTGACVRVGELIFAAPLLR